MDIKLMEVLKRDLATAIQQKDWEKVYRIKDMLGIPDEQAKYFNQGLTGYPSIDEVWLKNYSEDAEQRALNIPTNKTVWDVIEEKLVEFYDIPAIEYFGKQISRPEFNDLCYTWARTFRALGVEENEIIPIYGPFVPEIAAMFLGLIMIGACPYFLKLAISPEALAEETRDARFAVVFDGMWGNVAEEFIKDKYKNIIISNATMDMPSPKKEIVSFISKIQSLKSKYKIPDDKRFIWIDKALEMAKYHTGEVKVPFVPNRTAIITTSSGTTGKTIKAAEATNESILAQMYSTINSDIPYEKGFRTLNHFPPTAATSLHSLFFTGIVTGATIVMDPRVGINDFYNQLTKLNINACINTSSLWEAFFNMVIEKQKRGKKHDFSNAKAWMVGGEGGNAKQREKWDRIMEENGGKRVYGGYGLTETFSGIAIDRVNSTPDYTKPVPRVGAVQAGMIVGVFDKDGNELSYGQRGELRVKTKAQMKGYYGQPEMTNQVLVDGWVKTGDIAEIDEDGFLYIWGRSKDIINLPDGEDFYLFDIENEIRKNKYINDVIVLAMPTEENENNLVAHIVWENGITLEEKIFYLEQMNYKLNRFLPAGIVVSAYSEHDTMLPYSPTTLKKDKNSMSEQNLGYVQVVDGELKNIKFTLNENGKFSQEETVVNNKKGLFSRR